MSLHVPGFDCNPLQSMSFILWFHIKTGSLQSNGHVWVPGRFQFGGIVLNIEGKKVYSILSLRVHHLEVENLPYVSSQLEMFLLQIIKVHGEMYIFLMN